MLRLYIESLYIRYITVNFTSYLFYPGVMSTEFPGNIGLISAIIFSHFSCFFLPKKHKNRSLVLS